MELKSIELGTIETVGDLRKLIQSFSDECPVVSQRPGQAGYTPVLFYVLGETQAQLEIA